MYTGSEGLSLQANFVILGLLCLEMLSFVTRFNISGDHQYNIYRIFEINEAQNCAKLKIAEGLKDFAKIILKVFDGLPHGVLVDSISVEPSKLNFSNQSIVINIIE
jgi:hypothetical protein